MFVPTKWGLCPLGLQGASPKLSTGVKHGWFTPWPKLLPFIRSTKTGPSCLLAGQTLMKIRFLYIKVRIADHKRTFAKATSSEPCKGPAQEAKKRE